MSAHGGPGSGPGAAGGVGGGMSARYGQWHRDKSQQTRQCPRLIFFVIGGISYAEMRCAYEVMAPNSAASKHWDVLVGGTHLLVPEQFASDLEKLSYPVAPQSALAGAPGSGGGASSHPGGPENV